MKYAEVISVTRPKSSPSKQNWVRAFRVKHIHKPIPNKLYIQGIQVYTKYTGQQSGRICYQCKRSKSHLASDCPYKEAMENQNDHQTNLKQM